MNSPSNILHVEDDVADAELVKEVLATEGIACDVTRVETESEFRKALQQRGLDLVLADYSLPSFDGTSALKIVRQHEPDLPFIFVSGTMGEEVAIEALKIGATDYVLKTRLSRLVPSVQRAMREAKERADRKKAEEALRRSEHELRQVIQTIPAMVWSALPDGSNALMSNRWAAYTGSSAGGLGWQAAVHPDDLKNHMDAFLASSVAGLPFERELQVRRFDGEYRWFFVQGVPLRDEQGNILKYYGIVADIEDRKRSEEILRQQANLLEQAHDAILAWELSGNVVFWNRGAEYLYGFSREEAIGHSSHELLRTVHPMPREVFEQLIEREGTWSGELMHTTRDGRKVLVESRHVVTRGADGRRLVLETNRDITDRKRAEEERERLRQLEADLAHINRVSMMGALAASVAHEIKQPMAAVAASASACSRWLNHEPPEMEKARETASRIIKDVNRAAAIIDRVRSLYKRGTPKKEPVYLNELIKEMTVLLYDKANQNAVSIRTELDALLPKIGGDRVQLQQVLLNLMLNAIEAMKDTGGELTMTSKMNEDGRFLISVSDSGVGLPIEAPERIFETFFTTKAEGSGMGLCISRRIIESHGGHLWATANLERGATFHFTLPQAEESSSPYSSSVRLSR
jgi:PAS domain S-box-containing protein